MNSRTETPGSMGRQTMEDVQKTMAMPALAHQRMYLSMHGDTERRGHWNTPDFGWKGQHVVYRQDAEHFQKLTVDKSIWESKINLPTLYEPIAQPPKFEKIGKKLAAEAERRQQTHEGMVLNWKKSHRDDCRRRLQRQQGQMDQKNSFSMGHRPHTSMESTRPMFDPDESLSRVHPWPAFQSGSPTRPQRGMYLSEVPRSLRAHEVQHYPPPMAFSGEELDSPANRPLIEREMLRHCVSAEVVADKYYSDFKQREEHSQKLLGLRRENQSRRAKLRHKVVEMEKSIGVSTPHGRRGCPRTPSPIPGSTNCRSLFTQGSFESEGPLKDWVETETSMPYVRDLHLSCKIPSDMQGLHMNEEIMKGYISSCLDLNGAERRQEYLQQRKRVPPTPEQIADMARKANHHIAVFEKTLDKVNHQRNLERKSRKVEKEQKGRDLAPAKKSIYKLYELWAEKDVENHQLKALLEKADKQRNVALLSSDVPAFLNEEADNKRSRRVKRTGNMNLPVKDPSHNTWAAQSSFPGHSKA